MNNIICYPTYMGRKRIAENDRKKSTDYPQFAFRLTEKDKKLLTKEIKTVQDRLNRDYDKDKRNYVNKNDVILRALIEGLKKL